MLAILQHDLAEAERYIVGTQTLNQQLGEVESLVSNISDQAQLALGLGDFDKAEALLSRSNRLANENELPEEEAYAKVWLARLRERQQRIDEAFELAQQAYQIYERVGLRTPFVNVVEKLRDRLQLQVR